MGKRTKYAHVEPIRLCPEQNRATRQNEVRFLGCCGRVLLTLSLSQNDRTETLTTPERRLRYQLVARADSVDLLLTLYRFLTGPACHESVLRPSLNSLDLGDRT